MKQTLNGHELDIQLLGVLITPSWLSSIIDFLFSLAVILGTTVLSRYQGSSIRNDYLQYLNDNHDSIYRSVNSGILANPIVSNLPLLIFWALVGLIVYLFAANIVAAIRSTAALKDELEYTNVDRHSLLWQAGGHLLIRIIVLVVWLLYLQFFFHHVVPYCVAATLAGLSQLPNLVGIGYIVLAFLVLLVTMHLNTILLRLLLLKPRLFSKALYID